MWHDPARTHGGLAEGARGSLVYNSRIAHAFLRATLAEPVGRVRRLAELGALVFLALAVGTLLFRPAELLPSLEGAPIYEGLIIACLTLSFPRVLAALSLRALRANAIALLLLCMVPLVMLSHLAHANTYDARLGGLAMLKAVVFFFMVIALVDTPSKLKAILGATTLSVLTITGIAVLQYHGVIYLPTLQAVLQSTPDGGPAIARLCGIGVFNDPNDFSLILVVAGAVCAYGMGASSLGWWRWLLVIPLLLFGYALLLTHSRGGLFSGVAACIAFLSAKIGWRNTIPVLCVLAPLLLLPAWGRQTNVNLDDPEDTFQTRLGLWSDTLEAFRSAPVFGIGQGRLVETIGQVSHNSYVHVFAELGVLGGVAFTGAVYLVIRALHGTPSSNPDLARLRPVLLAMVVCYATGMLSLSRCYTVPTQLMLGLGTAYLLMASRHGGLGLPKFDWACIRRISAVGALLLVSTHSLVQVMLHRG